MGDGDMKTDGVIAVDAPELGARVELHEGTVGDALRLIEAQQSGISGMAFTLEALAISLRVDGKRFTVPELKALPIRATNALLRVGAQALELNRFFPKTDDDDDTPQTDDPKP